VEGSGEWSEQVVRRTVAALRPLADPVKAPQMQAYMKDVAPFLGVYAGPRRRALKAAWRGLPAPGSDEVGAAARALMSQTEREYHYAAYDLVERHLFALDSDFCRHHLHGLLTAVSWWDTIDGFVNAGVSPLCRRYGLAELIDEWSESGDRWLVRSAIGHQRGWKADTDIARVLDLCDRHWDDREFFVAKAIGWALRDIARMDATAIEDFLRGHPVRNPVAEREARRGLSAAGSRDRSRRVDPV
jgi:3-methyladenine DNA glycosylase AlkD